MNAIFLKFFNFFWKCGIFSKNAVYEVIIAIFLQFYSLPLPYLYIRVYMREQKVKYHRKKSAEPYSADFFVLFLNLVIAKTKIDCRHPYINIINLNANQQ